MNSRKVTDLSLKEQKFNTENSKQPTETKNEETLSERKVNPINVDRFSDKLQLSCCLKTSNLVNSKSRKSKKSL